MQVIVIYFESLQLAPFGQAGKPDEDMADVYDRRSRCKRWTVCIACMMTWRWAQSVCVCVFAKLHATSMAVVQTK